ncbi:hypothetical protein TEA_024374 [Camellia sinensis var. sinensis]|uniref:non-specific serine/threonine protein kinase n=1 Tax=Camellia sinensis var. sinensis TaxID=542762 RepID=A0A4V6RY59_CAMSN|nr:hypothetical protein TEA_024374 [Camellia sinensis var. sinensis]
MRSGIYEYGFTAVVKLTKEDVALFRSAVTKDYYFQMYYDDLPVWGFLGKVDKDGKADPSEYKYFLFKHLHFEILYNKDRVIEINVRTDPNALADLTEDKEVDVEFMYTVKRLDIMIDVACALEYLHHGYSVPVAHCDLKPSNVLLDDDMVAHVSDFGIAKLLGVGESIAQTRTIATFGYIAPEYGQEGLVSTKCDVYSYGIMLMETFTRTKPTDARFDGGLSLKCWVVDALPNAIVQVLDANLLRQDIEPNNAKVQCVSSLMQLALNCSADSPEERMIMKDVLVSIKKIRLRYVENCK